MEQEDLKKLEKGEEDEDVTTPTGNATTSAEVPPFDYIQKTSRVEFFDEQEKRLIVDTFEYICALCQHSTTSLLEMKEHSQKVHGIKVPKEVKPNLGFQIIPSQNQDQGQSKEAEDGKIPPASQAEAEQPTEIKSESTEI